jgi:hypothetical protein
MTKEQLINEATNRGFELHLDYEGQVGIRYIKKFSATIHWFNEYIYSGVSVMDFDHSYNQNTGKSNRGLNHSMIIKKSVGFYNEENATDWNYINSNKSTK